MQLYDLQLLCLDYLGKGQRHDTAAGPQFKNVIRAERKACQLPGQAGRRWDDCAPDTQVRVNTI